MANLKIFNNLTLVFINGELKVIHRKGKAYKVHEVKLLQNLKFNLGKHFLTLIDVRQIVEMNSSDLNIEVDGNRIVVRNVNLSL